MDLLERMLRAVRRALARLRGADDSVGLRRSVPLLRVDLAGVGRGVGEPRRGWGRLTRWEYDPARVAPFRRTGRPRRGRALVVRSGRRPALRLGEMLVARGLVTPEQVADARQRQAQTGRRLGQELVLRGVLAEADLMETLASRLGVPWVEMDHDLPDPGVASLVPEHIAQRHQLIPIALRSHELTVAMADPLNVLALDDILLMTGLVPRPVLASPSQIRRALLGTYGPNGRLDRIFEHVTLDQQTAQDRVDLDLDALGENDAPIIRLVNLILTNAITRRIGEIHLVPRPREFDVLYKLDGRLSTEMVPPKVAERAILARVRVMANLPPATEHRPRRGKITLRVGGEVHHFKLRTIPAVEGERIVLKRLVDLPDRAASDLGLEPAQVPVVNRLLSPGPGLVLIAASPGQGKTATLYALLASRATADTAVALVEETTEATLDSVTQLEWYRTRNWRLSVANALELSPSLLGVGDLRSDAAVAAALDAAGQLKVVACASSPDAFTALQTLLDRGARPARLARSLAGLVSQRLVRTRCRACASSASETGAPAGPAAPSRPASGGRAAAWLREDRSLVRVCPDCQGTGWAGRTALFEVVPSSQQLVAAIMEARDARSLRHAAMAGAGETLTLEGAARAKAAVRTIDPGEIPDSDQAA